LFNLTGRLIYGQRGEGDRLREYYAFSRRNILNTVDSIIDSKVEGVDILEVGWGSGYVSSRLHRELSMNVDITGMDIGPTAIRKAKALFPSLGFIVGDI
jgi:2-polyprenyl-3-methyl-5-hydroxy-6-metoxy-1,4-benzoquinol methylase